jgi:hypothetical protein
MDDFITIFRKSIKALGNSPILLAMGFILGIIMLPQLAIFGPYDEVIQSVAVDYTQILLPLLILPFLMGGALGYAVEIRNNGSSSLSTFMGSAVKNYPRMFMGGVISFILFYILYFVTVVIVLVAGLGDPWITSILMLLAVALLFLILMSLEFYDISIVAEGFGVIAAYKNSIDFVKRNLAKTVPFFFILVVFKALVQMPLFIGVTAPIMQNQTNYTSMIGPNATLNATALLSTVPAPMTPSSLFILAIFQVLMQTFVFAFLALYKADYYLSLKSVKRITDFDYDFSEEHH